MNLPVKLQLKVKKKKKIVLVEALFHLQMFKIFFYSKEHLNFNAVGR